MTNSAERWTHGDQRKPQRKHGYPDIRALAGQVPIGATVPLVSVGYSAERERDDI